MIEPRSESSLQSPYRDSSCSQRLELSIVVAAELQAWGLLSGFEKRVETRHTSEAEDYGRVARLEVAEAYEVLAKAQKTSN